MACERLYASSGDYAAWTGQDAPDDLDRRVLVRASRRVDRYLVGAVYDVDDAEMPTDPLVRRALREATCAQVEWWRSSGDITGTGTAERWDSVSIGDVRLTRGGPNGTSASASRSGGPGDLPPAVEDILTAVGLFPPCPWVQG